MLEKIKIGQIGIGHNHGEGKMLAVRKFPELFEVIGYAEEDEEWVRERGHFKGYEDLKRMSVEEVIDKSDAVLIECDVWNLTKTAQKCIDAGRHIHMDKPACGTIEEFRKLLTDAERKNLIVQMGYMYRYNPAVRMCIDMAKRGELGEIYNINAEMSTFHKKAYKEWLRKFNGGIMYILGSHLVDLSIYLMGMPQGVKAHLKRTGLDGVDVNDNNFALLEYEKGFARINVSSVEMNGWGRRQLVVSGSRGTVEIKPIESTTHMTYAHPGVSVDEYEDQKETIDVYDVPKDSRYDEMVCDFYKYITGEKQNPFTYEHELNVHKVLTEICGEN